MGGRKCLLAAESWMSEVPEASMNTRTWRRIQNSPFCTMRVHNDNVTDKNKHMIFTSYKTTVGTMLQRYCFCFTRLQCVTGKVQPRDEVTFDTKLWYGLQTHYVPAGTDLCFSQPHVSLVYFADPRSEILYLLFRKGQRSESAAERHLTADWSKSQSSSLPSKRSLRPPSLCCFAPSSTSRPADQSVRAASRARRPWTVTSSPPLPTIWNDWGGATILDWRVCVSPGSDFSLGSFWFQKTSTCLVVS